MVMVASSLHPPLLLPSPSKSQMLPILPTLPRSMMLPLLPTPSGHELLLALSAMPGRADFVQRWDTYKVPCSTASPSSSSDNGVNPGRADTVEKWNAHKKYKIPGCARARSPSSSSSDSGGSSGGDRGGQGPLGGSQGRADSVERWDSKKLVGMPLPTHRGRLQDGSNKRPPSRASSAKRWDLHKKHRPEEKDSLPQAEETTTAARKEIAGMHQDAFAGPNFYVSPEPSMLPMPSFLLRVH